MNGISQKLGFSQRSFAEWGNQISQSFIDGGKGLNGFKSALSTALIAPNTSPDIKLIDPSDFTSAFEVTDANEFFRQFNESGSESLSTLTQWSSQFDNMDDNMRSYLTECMQKQVPASYDGYEKYTQKAIKANEQLSLSTKAGQTALKALATAGNMVAFALLSQAVSFAATAIDDYIHRVENANKEMEDAVSACESTQSELNNINSELEENNKLIDELLKKEQLTYAEKGQLKELQDITKELLLQQSIEESTLSRNQKDAAVKAVDAYEEQYGDYDISDTAIKEHLDKINSSGIKTVSSGEDDISGNIAELISYQALLDETLAKLEDKENLTDDEIDYLASESQNYTDILTDINDNLDNSIADLADKKSAMEPEYQKAIEKQANGEWLSTDENDVISHYEEISEQLRLIYDYTNPDEWNHIQLSSIINAEGLEKSKDDLLAMAKAGELTPDALSKWPKLNKSLAESNLILQDGRTSAEAFCDELIALAENANIDIEPPDIEEPLNETFTAIKNSASAMQEFQSAIDSNQFTDSVLSSVGALSSELNDMVAGFYAGSVSADQLYQALSNHYNTDLQNYGNAIIAKNQFSEAFYDSLGLSNASFVNSFAENYGIDLENCKNYNQAKLQIENQTLNTLGSWWKKYYDTQSMTFTDDMEILRQSAANGNADSQKKYSQLMAQSKNYERASKAFDNNTYEYVAASYDKIANPFSDNTGNSSGSSAAAPAETKETFNFIETAVNRISSAIDKLKSKAEETFSSFTSRGSSYSEAIKKIGEELSMQEQAMQKYAANRDSVGLDESWAAQVRDGSLNIAEVSDSSLKEKIQEYQKWNDMVNECSDSISDLKKEQDELIRDKLELLITKYEKLSTKTAGANERIQNKIDLKESWGGLTSTKGYIKMNKNLSKQVGYARSQNSELRQLQKTVTKGSEAWHEYQEQIDKNNASMQDLTKSMVENAKAAAALAKEKANAKVEKYDSKDELYDAKIENAATSKAKNDLIDQKIDNIDNRQTAYDSAYNTSSNKLKSASDSISKMKKKSTKTKNAATNKANQTYNDVLAKVKARVKAGEKIPVVLLEKARKLKDNAKLYNACVQYNAYFDAKAENKEIADIYRETSQQDRAELTLEKFNNTAESYDNSLRSGKQQASVINNRISLANEQGKTASASDYKELIGIEEKNQKTLIDKRNALQNALDDAVKNGSVKENSEEWYEMKDAIDAVTNEIDESTRSIVEYQNAIRQLEWDKFDKGMESLKRDNSERDYQIDMLSHKKLVDDETGDFTDEGKTTLNLRKSNYQNYLTQAAKYQQEYQKLQSQIAKGELDADDEKVVARLRELEDAHHNVMLSAEDEKESIASLIKEGYDAQLNSLSKLIQKYKDLRQNAKDAYEYQKSISEKTKNIASLQKQLAAYGSNDTEEARAKIQQLKVDLENAKQDLKDTEYEKYLSDTNDMLDELYSDYEAFIDKKLEDTDTLLENIDSSITNMSDSVSTVLSSINQTTEDLIKALTASPSPQIQDIYPMGMIPPAVPNPISDMVLPKLDLNNSGYGNAVTISMGDIVLQDVQNPEQFSRQLVTAIADNPRVQRSIQSVSVERLVKSNGLSVNRYK